MPTTSAASTPSRSAIRNEESKRRVLIPAGSKSPTRHSPAKAARRAGRPRHSPPPPRGAMGEEGGGGGLRPHALLGRPGAPSVATLYALKHYMEAARQR